jgi:hypothetical protein
MPLYDVRVIETGEEKEISCSYTSLKEKIDSGELQIVHKSTAMIVAGVGGTLSRTSDGWKDLLKSIKKGSGRDNTIHN